jgi:hypothetical protein
MSKMLRSALTVGKLAVARNNSVIAHSSRQVLTPCGVRDFMTTPGLRGSASDHHHDDHGHGGHDDGYNGWLFGENVSVQQVQFILDKCSLCCSL